MVAIFRNLQATFIILSLLYTGKRVKFDPAGKLKSVFFFFLHADNLANFELNFDKKKVVLRIYWTISKSWCSFEGLISNLVLSKSETTFSLNVWFLLIHMLDKFLWMTCKHFHLCLALWWCSLPQKHSHIHDSTHQAYCNLPFGSLPD